MSQQDESESDKCWVVRLARRDNEDKWYFIDKSSNVNARMSSAAHYSKEVALAYAEAINNARIGYIATPRKLYADGKLWHRPDQTTAGSTGKEKQISMLTIKFKKLTPEAKIPCYAHEADSGMDISSVEDVTILPRSFSLIKTGIAAAIPAGYEIQVRPRSGMQCRQGIVAGFGTVDQGYGGEIGVVLYNHTDDCYHVGKGDRIAQLVLARVDRPAVVETNDSLAETDRGTNGFGSTGK